MRRKIRNILAVALLCAMSVKGTNAQSAFAEETRQPETFIVNGKVVYEESGEQGICTDEGMGVSNLVCFWDMNMFRGKKD